MKKLSIFGFILILASCATSPVIETFSSYDRNQIAWSLVDGTGKLEGDGFLSRRDGILVKCSGQEVGLVPVSDYAIERFTNIYGNPNGGYNTAGFGSRNVDTADPDYVNDRRTTICDVDGKFSFENLPSGEYYVFTTVIWRISDYVNEGGVMSRRVNIEEGKTSKVSLTY
jgi:hypothetical protein